ncbi:MAG: 2-isopropylmalate synthase [Nitrosopumilaceae archaeon]|nr:2-isopropylmalate synthase [Nitrosopumilaceae archaeon]NIU00581.1 2-isopropylmalate synthase [Nitrosopumilaceae archaeon]NIU86967.1 2-isopropylmalate synthase [Nitrosopumilaceae archaeon]NIV66431.1 2-isopropylmalate synthase [Nitrosopumilaceae archaeon]NIX61183.1 2-isopropylmalate synthase [Nitrosopumilaceae archaeon]
MKVRIFDTTLRDGEQTPGVTLSVEKKVLIAKKLDELGVDVIEGGFPIISEGERKALKLMVKENLNAEICGLARTNKKDIDAAIDSDLNYIHTFIATSDIHLKYKLNISREEAVSKAIDAVEYAKSHGLQVEFSAEDATRSDREFLKQMFGNVAKAGADRIDIPDTVGYATPQYMADITKDAIQASNLPISVHCHNDFGLAVANALSGIQAGAECAHVTINGIGERAGNASLEELVMSLNCLQFDKKWETGINTKLLYETSRYISKMVGMPVQANKAIVGENAFGHESGIHTHGVLSNPLTYEPISPELVGRTRWLQVGKHAGIHGLKAMLKEYGINPEEGQGRQILERVKNLGDQGKRVTDVELISIASDVMGDRSIKRIVQLQGFSVSTGIGTMPYAFVKLNIDGTDFSATDFGVGPVDAALNAIQKITGKIAEVRIKEYGLASISGGSNALCEVTIKVEDAKGNISTSKSIGEDIVTTSVQAVIDGMNRLMLKKEIKEKIEN